MIRSMRATAVVQPLPQWAVVYMGWIAGASFAELLRDFSYSRVIMQAAQRRVCMSERLVPVDLPPWAERCSGLDQCTIATLRYFGFNCIRGMVFGWARRANVGVVSDGVLSPEIGAAHRACWGALTFILVVPQTCLAPPPPFDRRTYVISSPYRGSGGGGWGPGHRTDP